MRTQSPALLLLVTLALITLTGCGDAAAPTATPSTTTPATTIPSGEGAPAASDASGISKATVAADAGKCSDADCVCCKEGEACQKDDCSCCKAKAAAADGPACLCAEGKAGKPVWCKKCDKGYVDGEEAHCEGCVKKAQKKLEDSGE